MGFHPVPRKAGFVAVAGAVVGIASLAGCASSQASDKSAVVSAQVVQQTSSTGCGNGQLAVTMSSIGGAAGSRYYQLRLANDSGRACTVAGYSGVSFTDSNGGQVGPAAQRQPSGYSTVTIEPSTAAYEMVRIIDAEDYPPSSCRAVPATGLRVYPPEQTASKTLPLTAEACASPDTQLLYVWPVTSNPASD